MRFTASASRPLKARESSIAGGANLRIAVAGCGAFGRNHLRVYRELESAGAGVELVAALESDSARAAETEAQYGIPVYTTLDSLLSADLRLDAIRTRLEHVRATTARPPETHAST